MKLIADGTPSQRLENPSVDDVEKAIRRLDGLTFTEVLLSDGESEGLLVTGGSECRYVCERIKGDSNWTLMNCDSESADNSVAIIAGGPPDFPTNMVVSVEQVISAMRFFCETGELDSSQTWESD